MLRYLPIYDENGNVLNPAVYVRGMATMAGEVNGGLDQDNFAVGAVGSADLTAHPFNLSLGDTYIASETAYSPDSNITGWQGGTGNNASGIGTVTWTTEQECHYDVHLSLSWSWSGVYSWVPPGLARPDRTDTFDTIQIRVTIDGATVCLLGPFEDGPVEMSAYGCGAVVLPGGTHTMRVEVYPVRMIAQDMQEDGPCTNTVTFDHRTCLAVGRVR